MDIDYWSVDPDVETLVCEHIDEAIEYHLDGSDNLTSGTIEVYGFKRMAIPRHEIENHMVHMMECIDSEYGNTDPYSEHQIETPEVTALIKKFIVELKAALVSWQCEPSGEPVKVDVKAWVEQNRPDWLKSSANEQGESG